MHESIYFVLSVSPLSPSACYSNTRADMYSVIRIIINIIIIHKKKQTNVRQKETEKQNVKFERVRERKAN